MCGWTPALASSWLTCTSSPWRSIMPPDMESKGGLYASGWPAPSGATLLAVGGQPAGEDIEEDGDRAEDQQRRDQPKADDQRINPVHVGQAGADAHDLGLAAIE